MSLEGLQKVAERIDTLVERLKELSREKALLLREKEGLQRRLNDLERKTQYLKKEEERLEQLVGQKKANKKKIALLREKVVSMLAKLEVLQYLLLWGSSEG